MNPARPPRPSPRCCPSNASAKGQTVWSQFRPLGLAAALCQLAIGSSLAANPEPRSVAPQWVKLAGDAGGKRFDGIGVVNGGGGTSVLLKDYPEPQRSQILDLVFRPKFGASVSSLYVEIPGDGNSTQGSMPSHMHTREDLNYHRGYLWWIMREAKKRNPRLTLDGAAWSVPGWIGAGSSPRFKGQFGDAAFWSQDTVDYYVKWLQGLRTVYGLEMDALGCRNEKGESPEFVEALRKGLDLNGFKSVKLHAFDNWPKWKFDFVKGMVSDEKLRESIDVISAHTMNVKNEKGIPPSREIQAIASETGKPIWNTEEHVYKKGFDCALSIVQAFNANFIHAGVTKIVNWYDIAALYPLEPYSEDPSMLLARSPWSGNYQVREALWGYAHYGQFTEVGWQYLNGGCGELTGGGSYVTLKSPGADYSIVIETKGATGQQELRIQVGAGLSGNELCVWRSNAKEQFIRQSDAKPVNGAVTISLDSDSIYSLSTTRGQQKGAFSPIPAPKSFPMPYCETFEEYSSPRDYGYLPRYTADIAGAFEIVDRPDKKGKAMRQVMPIPPISWAPDWHPYTILGDDQWQDYEIGADVYLNPGDTAAIMGRIADVGTGYGFVPKGYFFRVGTDGKCRLVVVRGKKEKKKVVGDAEQQALINSSRDEGEGGEKELGAVQLSILKPNQWHNVKLRFAGHTITGLIDGEPILAATDDLYARGMGGFLAGGDRRRVSTPYYDNLAVNAVNAPAPKSSSPLPGQAPIYSPLQGGR